MERDEEVMPLPTHLLGLGRVVAEASDDCAVAAAIVCSCGGHVFKLLFHGATHEYEGEQVPCTAEIGGRFFFRVEAECAACNARHLLFDKDFHGWDGFVCHDEEQAALPRPALTEWHCAACGQARHAATVLIEGEGKDDFVESVDGDFPEESWPDGFGWFSMSISCRTCGRETDPWISYEAM